MTETNLNVVLRNFIYIDKDRLYSFYSQLFEGVVESMVQSVIYGTEDTEKNRNLEQRIIDASCKVQNVVLFDHIYNSLEEKLKSQILIIDDSTALNDIKSNSIIKVTGYTTIEDYEHLSFLMKNFNEIGKALTILTLNKTNDSKPLSSNAIDQYAKSNGLYFDTKFSDSMMKIINNFHGNVLEIFIEPSNQELDVTFKALLDEKYLRLSSNSIRNLYGYKPCMKWTLVGEVTNMSYSRNRRSSKQLSALSDMFETLSNIDSFSINESENNTVRIAPIAVYIDGITNKE